ncbi:general odorant-binding protein 83a-like [Microplitis demolitor]|uniref:general odorant-binding protein 83a-like n=1 Tax=Microplitis demolitor TaxID=69319 RepID=UPI0004CCDF89|nr:general odorant-binding protein 83a-like [Microplitis demolitor]
MTVEQIKSFMKPMGKKCREKIGLDPELQAGQHRGEFPEDEKLMCYHACLYEAVKVTDKNGVANADMVIRQMGLTLPEGIKQIAIAGVKKCDEQLTPQEVCRVNYNYMKCYYTEANEAYFFP